MGKDDKPNWEERSMDMSQASGTAGKNTGGARRTSHIFDEAELK